MARRAKAEADETIEPTDVDAGDVTAQDVPDAAENTPVEVQPELWQELELPEDYKGKDAAEIARDLRRQQREAEQEYQQKYAESGLAAYRYANESIKQMPEWQEFEKFRAEKATKQEPAKKWYERPDFDPSILEDYRIVNEDGTKGGVDRKALAAAGLLDKALAYQQFVENHDGRWEKDRENYLGEFLDHALPTRIEKAINEAKAKWEDERDWQEWDQANSDWMYVLDENKQRMIDPNTQRWALTQEGLTFHQIFNELRQDGISNTKSARNRATQIMLGMFAAQTGRSPSGAAPAARAEAPAPTKKDKHLDHINKVAGRHAGRGGSLPHAAVPNKEQQVRRVKPEDQFEAMFTQRMGLNAGA